MQTSLYLAKLLGPVLLAVGASMLLDPSGYIAMAGSMLNDTALVYIAAVIGLIGGIALVLAHNVWAADWRVIITLLGWTSVVDSVSWILLTRPTQRFWAPLLTSTTLPVAGGIAVGLLGSILCLFGYRTSRSIWRH